MKNRVSKYPNRFVVTPEDGSAPFQATITRADEPIEEGTPLNKATLLTDETANSFGLGEDAVVDDVLNILHQKTFWTTLLDTTATADKTSFSATLSDDIRKYTDIAVICNAPNVNGSSGSAHFSIGGATIYTRIANRGEILCERLGVYNIPGIGFVLGRIASHTMDIDETDVPNLGAKLKSITSANSFYVSLGSGIKFGEDARIIVMAR